MFNFSALFFFFTIKQKALSHFYLGSIQSLVATPERVAALCLGVLRFAAVGQGLVAGLGFVCDFFTNSSVSAFALNCQSSTWGLRVCAQTPRSLYTAPS